MFFNIQEVDITFFFFHIISFNSFSVIKKACISHMLKEYVTVLLAGLKKFLRTQFKRKLC
jgi:hypothetical protein